ncbi:hypothetical protein SAMN04515668_2467 [Hymenobacter arizonensis]|uniref:Uncharacterized protein n=2 Tax=Hymenobacter arizonensis TaxID=1227077 RepID=A0A1I5YUZ2_HYMAR|nr:hypothetical protein SAMN04515668_2467 [Hymenobacter arizonensis]
MDTKNDPNNPQNIGTGAGANFGTRATGTGLGNSVGSSNEGSSYNATPGNDSGLGTTNSGAPAVNLPTNSVEGDDFSATAKGAAMAGTPGAVVGRAVDGVQNTADHAAHAVTGQPYDSSRGTNMSGMFRDRDSAERAYQSLSSRGYSKDDVNVLMSDDTRKTHFGDDTAHTELGDKAMEGAGVGSAIGGTAGAIIGAIAAIGTSVALPGLGLVIAGPLAAALAGAGAGGLTGGLVGALVGSGIPEEHAAEYEQGIKEGGIVMGVKPRNEEDARYFEEEFRRHNGDKIYKY